MSECRGGEVGCLTAFIFWLLLMNTCGLHSKLDRIEDKLDTQLEESVVGDEGPLLPEWAAKARHQEQLPEDRQGWKEQLGFEK